MLSGGVVAVAFGETAKRPEGVGVVEGSYLRGPEGLTYRGWRVLIRGAGGLVAVVEESATDQAERLGCGYDAQWSVADQCGCDVGMIRHLIDGGGYEATVHGREDHPVLRTPDLEEGLRWISVNEAGCQFRTGQRPRQKRNRGRGNATLL